MIHFSYALRWAYACVQYRKRVLGMVGGTAEAAALEDGVQGDDSGFGGSSRLPHEGQAFHPRWMGRSQ